MSFTIINQNETELNVGQVFFLHPTKSTTQGSGWSGTTGIHPREDLGDILIDTKNLKTYILDSNSIINIPAKSSVSFILKYSFLNPSNTLYNEWKDYKDQMILGIRYFATYDTRYPVQETYAPLYNISKSDFNKLLVNLFNKTDEEWKIFCCSRGICDCN